MKGIIGFEHYKITCIVGVYPQERAKEQDIYIDLKAEFDVSRCVKSDRVEETLDYVKLAEMCRVLAQTGKYQLLEKLAYDVLKKVVAEPGVSKAWIKVKKPGGLADAEYTTVEMTSEV